MSRLLAVAIVALALTSCDSGIRFHGSVASSSGQALSGCSWSIYSQKAKTVLVKRAFEPPNFEGGAMTGPFRGGYVVLGCKGHQSLPILFRNDGSESTDLGHITLADLSGG